MPKPLTQANDAQAAQLADAQERLELSRLEGAAAKIARDRLCAALDDDGVKPAAQARALTIGRRRALEGLGDIYPRTPFDPSADELLAGLSPDRLADVTRETPAAAAAEARRARRR